MEAKSLIVDQLNHFAPALCFQLHQDEGAGKTFTNLPNRGKVVSYAAVFKDSKYSDDSASPSNHGGLYGRRISESF